MCEERREECDNRTVAITAIFDYFKNNVLMPRNGDEISLCSSCRRSIRDIIYLTRRGVLFMDRSNYRRRNVLLEFSAYILQRHFS